MLAPAPVIDTHPVTSSCIVATAKRFALPTKLLFALLKVENGRVGKVSYNANGSFDMGPMQINSQWLSTFKPYASAKEILYNGCVNVQVGAWILRHYINEAGGNVWRGIGYYHSHNPVLHNRYLMRISDALKSFSE